MAFEPLKSNSEVLDELRDFRRGFPGNVIDSTREAFGPERFFETVTRVAAYVILAGTLFSLDGLTDPSTTVMNLHMVGLLGGLVFLTMARNRELERVQNAQAEYIDERLEAAGLEEGDS